jgi:hypothetical protein
MSAWSGLFLIDFSITFCVAAFATISSIKNLKHKSVRRPFCSIKTNEAVPCVTTMTKTAAPPSQTLLTSLPPDTDNYFGFLLKDWKDFPDTDMIPPEHLLETQNDRVKRIYEETVQRNDTTPTAWHRFSTLG